MLNIRAFVFDARQGKSKTDFSNDDSCVESMSAQVTKEHICR
jgi:hypothetical protein